MQHCRTLFRHALLTAACSTFAGLAVAAQPIEFRIGSKSGDPMQALPNHIRSITSFGERPIFSPDGRRIAFIGSMYGDAFEYDLETNTVRNLTGHNPHGGFLRVHYLADGNYILVGVRGMGKDREDTRENLSELWFLNSEPGSVLVPLGEKNYEGIATSRNDNRIVWSSKTGDLRAASTDVQGHTALMTAMVRVEGRNAWLEDSREVVRKPFTECVMEPQDFRDNDREVTAACYGGEFNPDGSFRVISGVWGVRMDSGEMIQYYLDDGYNEVEGIAPEGNWTTVECGPAFGEGLDICRLDLLNPEQGLQRMTHFLDYGPHRVSNPYISPDGRLMAFQYGVAEDEPGAGRGLLLMDLSQE